MVASCSILMGLTIAKPVDRVSVLALGCLIFFIPLATVLHEFAHALADLALGLRLFVVSYGLTGRLLYRRRFFNCALEIRSSLSGGLALAAPRSTRWLRLRWWLVVAAAPSANALLAAGAFAPSPKSPVAESMAQSFAWANVIILGASMFPWRYVTPYGVNPSDGLALFKIPVEPAKKLQQLHAAYFALEGMECLRRKNYEQCEAWALRGLHEYPGEISNRNILALALVGLQRYGEARAQFLDMAENSEPPADEPPNKAIFLNNVAWIDLLVGDDSHLDEADRYSRQAMRLTPWVAAIKGRRGSVLVTLGQTDEGIRLLEAAMEENEENANKAFNACYLSIGFKKEGNLAASRRFLEKAGTLDPECELIPRAVEELTEPTDFVSAASLPADQSSDTLH